MVRRVATTVRLPSLAQRRERIPAPVRAMLAALPAPDSETTLSSAARERLAARHCPRNVAELEATVARLARRAAGGPTLLG
ncbi:hypothetical protein [Pseudonocardia xishanensis]|uniref:Sigma-54 factor interaction domain-containing protein n=1 Tax=Pseudonocardia xishanensis TaxID=630995 RepID=A0ABP8S214_9PSEU